MPGKKISDHGLQPRNGNKQTNWFCIYCHRNGYTPNCCREKLRDEEIRRVQHDMSVKKIVAPKREYGDSIFNCRSQYDQKLDRRLDSDDGNIPNNEILTPEEA